LTRRVSILLSLVLPLALIAMHPASASDESDFVSRTNSARASADLRSYAVRYDLTGVARRQAARMASARQIYHNPNLGSEVGNWRALAENVGRGTSVSAIQNAFMNSSAHRDNILSRTYTEVGIGTARGGDGQIYVSEVFRLPASASAPPPPATAPHRVTTTRTYRASRGTPRRAPAVVPPRKAKVVVNPLSGRLDAAWRMYRRARPVDPLDRAQVYLRTSRYLAASAKTVKH
jgi:Cysteine-rich secretory protein family